ncbi:probable Transcription-associated protein 1 [Saccharomycodes ludwigii]|uniref:Probable Transcription-associated protein 1 n=1 Tax=Saccharomycodes ludwigii TaxID=36035 RepID=A0A376B535_9ASCO|nr:probable Transcription-associated protein 1 [Saccharomycodes ludwigii]
MSYVEQIDTFVSRLITIQQEQKFESAQDTTDNKNENLSKELLILTELCDVVEVFNSSIQDNPYYLEKTIPILLEILQTTPISFKSNSIEHKIRNVVLETISRSTLNDQFEKHSLLVLKVLLEVLKQDNEENAVIAIKITTGLFKTYRTILVNEVDSFVAIILQMYDNISELVESAFPNSNANTIDNTNNSYIGNESNNNNNGNLLDPATNSTTSSDSMNEDLMLHSSDTNMSNTTNYHQAMKSFKVLIECPLCMVTLFSSYKQLVQTAFPSFIPLIIKLLMLQAEPQKLAREEALKSGRRCWTSVSPEIKNRSEYCNFTLAQVKATSFLAYVFIRGHVAEYLQNYVKIVPELVMRLLQDLPCEMSHARKELLHATRHILSTNYKKLFLPQLDLLFDEKVLLSDGFTVHETLRTLAYSMLADFIHNVRNELTLDYIEKTIRRYSKHMKDDTLALTVQVMSAKLLLNLMERIIKLGKDNPNDAVRARKLLMLIIESYTERLRWSNKQYDHIMHYHEQYEKNKNERVKGVQDKINSRNRETEEFVSKILKTDEFITPISNDVDQNGDTIMKNDAFTKYIDDYDISNYSPISIAPAPTSDPLKDISYLYKTILSFLKTIIHDIKIFNPPSNDFTNANPKVWYSMSRVFSYEEVLVFKTLFHEGISGMHFFCNSVSQPAVVDGKKKYFDITSPNMPVSASREARDIMDYFAVIFMQIDTPTFNEIVRSEIEFMYDSMVKDSALLHIAQSFLTSEVTSPNFTSILLNFLNKKLEGLGNADVNTANILIRLYKLSFMSVNLYPVTNEVVLLPHLNNLILDSLKYSTKVHEPLVYFYLIRTLFRSIGGGKFENLYRFIKPILQVLLQSLNRMILMARRPHERDLYVELCLTVPVRLSVLAPYLNYLMVPLVYALQGFPDLISQGLRTLELCIDNLTAEYFDPIIEPVYEKVIIALFKLLKPYPYNHQISHTTVRVLGKLGGRNRKFLKPPSDLKTQEALDIGVNALFEIYGINGEVPVSVTPGVKFALDILYDYRIDVHYRVQSFKYLSSILKLFLAKNSEINFDSYAVLVQRAVGCLSQQKLHLDVEFCDKVIKYPSKLANEQSLFLTLLESLFFAASVKECREESTILLKSIIDHICLIQVNNELNNKICQPDLFNIEMKQPDVYISTDVLVEALSSALGSYLEDTRTLAVEMLKHVKLVSKKIYGDSLMYKYSFIPKLMEKFIHDCYGDIYFTKSSGVLGIKVFLEELDFSVDFWKNYQLPLINGLLFVVKDTPVEAPSSICETSDLLICSILKKTCADLKVDDLMGKPIHDSLTEIVCELSCPHAKVRETSKKALETVSNVTNIPIANLMEVSKNFLLSPIFAKPLRALPFSMQIGNVDAITFCLSLPNSFLEFNEELYRLLHETIALVDADDESLASLHRVHEYKTSQQLVELRVVCIKLLSLALKNESFATSQQGATRFRILAVFFKAMLKPSNEIIDATYEGLKLVLSDNFKLPKELLQNGLKPMLMNLSYHEKLTVHGMRALSRVLELLIAHFKVEIGRKLLDHLDSWCSLNVLDNLFGKDIYDQPQTNVIYSIVDIFYLLPAQADMFLGDLLLKVMVLEKRLRLQLDSPFRVPLAKYLNRFHKSVILYFSKNLNSRPLVMLLCSIIRLEESKTLLADFEEQLETFIKFYITGISSNPSRCVSFFSNVIDIFLTLSEIKGDEWFLRHTDLLIKIRQIFILVVKTINTNNIYIDHLQLNQAIEKFQMFFLRHMELNNDHVDFFFEFIDFTFKVNIKLIPPIEKFIYKNIVSTDDKLLKMKYITKALNYATYNMKGKCTLFVLKKIVNNGLIYDGFIYGNLDNLIPATDSLDVNWLMCITDRIWRNTNLYSNNKVPGELDFLRFELLQLSACVIKWHPKITVELKKDIVKFGWSYIKLSDPLTKQAAYMLISYFISGFNVPTKIITQIFVALLRNQQVETRYMVRESLDLLAPVMYNRMFDMENSRIWVKWVRRVLSENNHNQNTTIYHFLTRHVSEFFPDRDHFVPNIISYLGKLVFLTSPTVESQVMAIDQAELILKWEKLSKKENNRTPLKILENEENEENKGNKGEFDPNQSTEKVEEGTGAIEAPETLDRKVEETPLGSTTLTTYQVPLPQREACITFLIRYLCASSHRVSEVELGIRALNIMSELISADFWPEVNVKLEFFEKFLISDDLSSPNILCYCLNALTVLAVVLDKKAPQLVVDDLPRILSLLDKCLHSEHQDIQIALQKVLRIILGAIKTCNVPIDTEQDSPAKNFITALTATISDDLRGSSSVAAGIMLSWSLFMYFDAKVDSLLPLLMKTFSKLCSDHLATSQPKDATTIEEARITTKFLEKVFYILSSKIGLLADSRRPFLSLVAMLIDRSMDQKFLKQVIYVCKNWTFSNEIFPTVKEKAAILTKMLAFEIRGEPILCKDFYSIVLDLFQNPNYANTELTVRMEQPFLVGTRIADIAIRKKLMSILNSSLEPDVHERLYYIVRDQNWEFISDYPWLNQALQLLYGAFNSEKKLRLESEYSLPELMTIEKSLPNNVAGNSTTEHTNTELFDFIKEHEKFMSGAATVKASDILEPLVDIFYQAPESIYSAWVSLFPIVYRTVRRNEKFGFVRSLVSLLSKDYHLRQKNSSVNVLKALLDGLSKVEALELPPHLVKYISTSHKTWYEGLNILESLQENNSIDNNKIAAANEDALLEMYISLQETDMFYGLWKRRAKFAETSTALSYEQIGLWDKAQQMYEAAQVKARSGALPYSKSEYALWEDDWIMCAEELQQWDILTELAKHEGFIDLLLECGWRVADWHADREALEQSIKSVMDVPTPRRQVFETFLALQKFADTKKGEQEVRKLCDEGVQLSLHKWCSLPNRYTEAHKGLLHGFQQYVEFLEAIQIYNNLASTNAQNLDAKTPEVKRILQCWRDRLPNIWDDVNIWNDLITWRQHVFQGINNTYLPLIPALQQNSNRNVTTHAYKGYHEIAWVINRFAHVARKHHMPDVCISQLARIYTLPNIEIQEAFLKLREQAKCHYQNMNELTTGLDVISNTNLVYFGTVQKAEFFTLKGMFLSKLRAYDEANQAFATAVQIDLNLGKAWAQWGYFNDRRLSENPENISYANNALSCYLQAAGLYKSSKTRKLLCRILWLIGIDDKTGCILGAFNSFRGEVPVWYWITFIPQLLTSLSHREANMVRQILIRIAKSYPQSLHFQLRTTKEDFAVIQRQTMAAVNNSHTTGSNNTTGNSMNPSNTSEGTGSGSLANKQPWEYLDELNGILKTAYPLLALSLESLVDQINNRVKSKSDEELFRMINVLLLDATFNYNRVPYPRNNVKLPANTEANLVRFSENLLPPHIRVKFNEDFIDNKPGFEAYIQKLRTWRNRLENKLDRLPRFENIERIYPHLNNFHHQKFEDIEIPGQYLLNKDNNAHFIKIARFMPQVEFVRSTHSIYRRLTIRGNDGSLHVFAVQHPAVRHSRREERIFQLFRLFNETLSKNVETKRRNILFTLPITVPLSPQVRIINDSCSYVTLHQIYDQYCLKTGLDRDAIQDFFTKQMNIAYDKDLPLPDVTAVKVEIFSAIQSTFLPNTVVKDYFITLFDDFESFWLFRKQFSAQYGAFCFMSYMLSINARYPHKIHIDSRSGNCFTLEMLPARYPYERVKQYNKNFEFNIPPDAPVFYNNEAVPFRLTPNIQKLIGDSAMEGIFSVAIFIIARALMEPENELNTYLSLFIRDEVVSWYSNLHRSITEDPKLLDIVSSNIDLIIRRVAQLGHLSSTPSVATQYVLDAISAAVTPRNLANTDISFMPYL